MGAAAPANLPENIVGPHVTPPPELKLEPKSESAAPVALGRSGVADTAAGMERLQSAVLQALTDGNQRILVSMLEAGEWSVVGNEVVIKVSESQTVVDMSVSNEARRLAIASASGVMGRAVKLKIIPGAAVATEEKGNGAPRANPAAGGRGRAEQDAVVRRLREKFGAEIRTVIDYREKR